MEQGGEKTRMQLVKHTRQRIRISAIRDMATRQKEQFVYDAERKHRVAV